MSRLQSRLARLEETVREHLHAQLGRGTLTPEQRDLLAALDPHARHTQAVARTWTDEQLVVAYLLTCAVERESGGPLPACTLDAWVTGRTVPPPAYQAAMTAAQHDAPRWMAEHQRTEEVTSGAHE